MSISSLPPKRNNHIQVTNGINRIYTTVPLGAKIHKPKNSIATATTGLDSKIQSILSKTTIAEICARVRASFIHLCLPLLCPMCRKKLYLFIDKLDKALPIGMFCQTCLPKFNSQKKLSELASTGVAAAFPGQLVSSKRATFDIYTLLKAKNAPWCRYCGTSKSHKWLNSALGPMSLCSRHSTASFASFLKQPSHPILPILRTICAICSEACTGETKPLLTCRGCPFVYHSTCYQSRAPIISPDDWFCGERCKKNLQKCSVSVVIPNDQPGLPFYQDPKSRASTTNPPSFAKEQRQPVNCSTTKPRHSCSALTDANLSSLAPSSLSEEEIDVVSTKTPFTYESPSIYSQPPKETLPKSTRQRSFSKEPLASTLASSSFPELTPSGKRRRSKQLDKHASASMDTASSDTINSSSILDDDLINPKGQKRRSNSNKFLPEFLVSTEASTSLLKRSQSLQPTPILVPTWKRLDHTVLTRRSTISTISKQNTEDLSDAKLQTRHARFEEAEKTVRLLRPGVFEKLVNGFN